MSVEQKVVQTSEIIDKVVISVKLPKNEVERVIKSYNEFLVKLVELGEATSFLGLVDFKGNLSIAPKGYIYSKISEQLKIEYDIVFAILESYKGVVELSLYSGKSILIYGLVSFKVVNKSILVKTSTRFSRNGMRARSGLNLYFKERFNKCFSRFVELG